MMRAAFAVLLLLVFLAAAIFATICFWGFFTRGVHGLDIDGLLSALIATICIAAWFISTGQDEIVAELARRERTTHTEPSERM